MMIGVDSPGFWTRRIVEDEQSGAGGHEHFEVEAREALPEQRPLEEILR
jgi:hypothetical protein